MTHNANTSLASKHACPAVPILMYHKVGAAVNSKADTFLNVSARDFGRQMRLLSRLGYQGVTFAQVAQAYCNGAPLPKRPVCVTFDDGHTCVGQFAAPILKEVGWPATVFVPTAYVGDANTWDRVNGKPILPIMNGEQLTALARDGWELAGHTRSHAHLDQLDDEQSLHEIVTGKLELERLLGAPITTFCYPFGGLNTRTPALTKQAGFIAACTTKSGLASSAADPFLLPRVKVAYRDGVLGLLYRLWIRPRL